MQELVSIVVINYKNIVLTQQFLDDLKNQNYLNLQIIVVDNESENDIEHLLNFHSFQSDYIRSTSNLGFAGGNNLGITLAKGKYIFFINNDVELASDAISNLVLTFENNKSIGLISPKIKFYHHKDLIQYAGFKYINPLTGRNQAIGSMQIDNGQFDKKSITAYAHGAAMMIRKNILPSVGIMPEIYFLYYEELEWSNKVRIAGFEVLYEPSSVVWHKQSLSIGKDNPLKMFYLTRNRILFMYRNYSKIQFYFFILFYFILAIPKDTVKIILNRNFKLLKIYYEAVHQAFRIIINYSSNRSKLNEYGTNRRAEAKL